MSSVSLRQVSGLETWVGLGSAGNAGPGIARELCATHAPAFWLQEVTLRLMNFAKHAGLRNVQARLLHGKELASAKAIAAHSAHPPVQALLLVPPLLVEYTTAQCICHAGAGRDERRAGQASL